MCRFYIGAFRLIIFDIPGNNYSSPELLFHKLKKKCEGVHLTLPSHILFIQVRSGTCYITGKWGRVQNKIKEA